MHTFSPARMWIAGLNALQKPLLHLHTQFNRDLPWAEIDMDFMNLQPVGPRRPRVRVHRRRGWGWRAKWSSGTVSDPAVRERIGTWAARRAGGSEAQSLASPASATTCATSRSPRATRSRRRSGSASRSTATASATSRTRVAGARDASRRAARRVRGAVRRRCPSCGRRRAARVAARGRAHRGRTARVPRRAAASARSPTRSRIWAG